MRMFPPEVLPVSLFGKETFPNLTFLLLVRPKTFPKELAFTTLFSKEVFYGNGLVANTKEMKIKLTQRTYKINITQKGYKVVLR